MSSGEKKVIGAASALRERLAAVNSLRKNGPSAEAVESSPVSPAPSGYAQPAPSLSSHTSQPPQPPQPSGHAQVTPGGGQMSRITLTPDQALAASFGTGTRAIVATAGSGKTTTMSYRIASLLSEHGVRDRDVLATTFTNAGAADLKHRIDSMAGRTTAIQAGTLHSFCIRLVFSHSADLGYVGQPTVLDESQRASQIDQLMLQVTGKSKKKDITTFSSDDVYRWMAEFEVREFSSDARDQSPWTAGRRPPAAIAEICRLYKERSRQFGYLDFDSILTEALRLLRLAPPALTAALPRHVFIDEAQDLSAIQWFIVQELSRHAKSLDVVGDDDQSLYSWRGALPWRFRDFAEKADQRFFLSANRRCSAAIVRLAGEMIAAVPPQRRLAKDLSAVRDFEGTVRFSVLARLDSVSLIAQKILAEVDEKKKTYGDFAVVVRSTTSTFDAVEGAFKKRGIPYKILGGKSTFDKPEAILVRAIGNLIVKKDSREPFAHWTTLFTEVGVSAGAGDRLLQDAQAGGGSFDSISWAVKRSRISEANRSLCESLLSSIRTLRALARPTMADIFKDPATFGVIRAVIGRRSRSEIEDKRRREGGLSDEQADSAAKSLAEKREEALKNAMAGLMDAPLSVTMMTLDLSSKDQDDDGTPKVTLTTAHSAKGLEWDTVFVMEVNKASWPSAMAGRGLGEVPLSVIEEIQDEERRLLYVAATRAKNELFLVSTVVHPRNGDSQVPSEFLPLWLREKVTPVFNDIRRRLPSDWAAADRGQWPPSQGIKIDVPR